MREHPRPGPTELPAAERRECPGAPLRDLRPVDDRDRDTRPRIVEGHERELGGQAAHVIVDVVADDLDPCRRERPDGGAENVEVAGERRVGHVVDAWVERDGPLTLRAHRRFDRIEDVCVREVELPHVVAGEKQELERRGSHATTICGVGAGW